MGQELMKALATKLSSLDKGAYARGYMGKGGLRRSSLHHLVGELLDGLKIDYTEDSTVKGVRQRADFVVGKTLVFVDKDMSEEELLWLQKSDLDCLLISRDDYRSDDYDHGIRVIGVGEGTRQQTIFLDDPSFNFDYAHILPKTKKCSVMHGHTSSVLVEIVGRPIEGMVVDFGDAKEVVRDAVRSLDHKLFIDEKYVTAVDPNYIELKFKTVHGDFAIRAPKATTVLMEGEATVENMAKEVLARVSKGMPKNVSAVGVYVYEGMNKGSHLIAKIHRDEVGSRRRKR